MLFEWEFFRKFLQDIRIDDFTPNTNLPKELEDIANLPKELEDIADLIQKLGIEVGKELGKEAIKILIYRLLEERKIESLEEREIIKALQREKEFCVEIIKALQKEAEISAKQEWAHKKFLYSLLSFPLVLLATGGLSLIYLWGLKSFHLIDLSNAKLIVLSGLLAFISTLIGIFITDKEAKDWNTNIFILSLKYSLLTFFVLGIVLPFGLWIIYKIGVWLLGIIPKLLSTLYDMLVSIISKGWELSKSLIDKITKLANALIDKITSLF